MSVVAQFLAAVGATEPSPPPEPSWHGWPLLAAATCCAIGLWRWHRHAEAPKHTVTQIRRDHQ